MIGCFGDLTSTRLTQQVADVNVIATILWEQALSKQAGHAVLFRLRPLLAMNSSQGCLGSLAIVLHYHASPGVSLKTVVSLRRVNHQVTMPA